MNHKLTISYGIFPLHVGLFSREWRAWMTKKEALERVQGRIDNMKKIIHEDQKVYDSVPDDSPAKGTIGRLLRKREVVLHELTWALSIISEIESI